MPNTFWSFIENRPSRAAVAAEWQIMAAADLPAVQGLLTPLERLAEFYPDVQRGGRAMPIVRCNNGSIVAVDELDHQKSLSLSHSDIVLHQVDLLKLRKSIADALDGVRISRAPVDETCPTMLVGTWEPKRATGIPIYLMLCGNPRRLREELLLLVARQAGGAILLTPTRNCCGEDFQALARQWKMLPVPLCEVLTLSPVGFVASDAWKEYLLRFSATLMGSLPGNTRSRRPLPRRCELTAKIEKLKDALKEYIYSTRDYVVASIDAGRGAELPETLTKVELAKLAGLEPYHITRCFDADMQLGRLLEIANDSEELLRFGKKRRG